MTKSYTAVAGQDNEHDDVNNVRVEETETIPDQKRTFTLTEVQARIDALTTKIANLTAEKTAWETTKTNMTAPAGTVTLKT